MTDQHPELDGYEPFERTPARRTRKRLILQIVVLAAVVALVLPGILTTASVAARNGEQSCAYRTSVLAPLSTGFESRFEVFGPGGLGFEICLVAGRDASGHEWKRLRAGDAVCGKQ